MIIDFRSFTITINTNNSITIATNFNAPSGPSSNNYRIIFDNNQSKYLTTSKGSQTQTISSGAVYNYIYQQIGNETSKQFTAYIIYNTSRSNDLQATATIPEYSLSMSASSTDTNNGGQTTNYETQSIHYVNEFTSGTTYLGGWSKPRIDYLISSSTGYLYKGPLTLGGAITGTAQLGTTSLQLGTDFEAGTYSVGAGDGRDAVVASHTISRINWQQPSITFSLSRYNSVGRRIDWNLEGIWSYISNALQPNVNFQLTYNNNTYTLYTKNDEYYWYDGTHLYKDTTGAEIGSFDMSTYSLGVPIEYPTLSQVSNVTANGQFILVDENDYKYSITASAYLTDNIDYRVYANSLIPSGLPAIYCHKDSNSNNEVDIYGDLSVDGRINLGANGVKTLDSAGFTTDRYGNLHHQRATASDELQFYDYSGNVKARYLWESGNLKLNGSIEASGGYVAKEITNENILTLKPGLYYKEGSTGWTENGWPIATWHATLKVSGTAYDDNNGYRVLEVFTTDNKVYRKTQSWSSWSNWELIYSAFVLYTGDTNTGTITLSDSSANYDHIDIVYRSNDGSNYVSTKRVYSPNSKITDLQTTHSTGGAIYTKYAEVSIGGTSIDFIRSHEYYFSNSSGSQISSYDANNIYITKVVGYK